MTRVLVAHASKYGSVEEVAADIGAILAGLGLDCDVLRAHDVDRLDGYDLVVLGTGLYMGRLHREARRFLRRHHEALAVVPFAVFAMGPLSDEPAEKEKVRPQLERALARYPGGRTRRDRDLRRRDRSREDSLPVQPHARGRPPRLGRDPRLRLSLLGAAVPVAA